jgi:hypothetical protein
MICAETTYTWREENVNARGFASFSLKSLFRVEDFMQYGRRNKVLLIAVFSGLLLAGLLMGVRPQPVSSGSAWVINEINADPDATNGDANGDGTVSSSQDEFIEIVNVSGVAQDISGWTLSDGDTTAVFAFPPGTVIPDQCAAVLFGGGTPTGLFGNAFVFTDDGSIGTGLANGGDDVILADDMGNTVVMETYGSEGGDNQSLTRDPDLTGPFVKHSLATGSGGTLFSPGTQIDGTFFSGCPTVQPPFVDSTEPANGASGVITTTDLVITFSEPVTVTAAWLTLTCDSGAQALTLAPLTDQTAITVTPDNPLPAAESCTATVAAAEVADGDGLNMVADYMFEFATALPPLPEPTVWINEFHYDNAGTDVGEFIEVAGPAGTYLEDWSIALYNGGNGSVYATLELTGTIPSQEGGFGTLSFNGPATGIQNGAPDGMALVDNEGVLVQFLSYEGEMTATDGPAAGLTSQDVGVAEGSSTLEGYSLQLVDPTGQQMFPSAINGTGPSDFVWSGPIVATRNSPNTDQALAVSLSGVRVDGSGMAAMWVAVTGLLLTIGLTGLALLQRRALVRVRK